MEKELLDFVKENGLSPFNRNKTQIRNSSNTIFKTKDAKTVYQKVISNISSNFKFADTSNLFNKLSSTSEEKEILKRQEFFKSLQEKENNFLKELKLQKTSWKPPYDITVVTENEKTFTQLKEMGCPVKIIFNERDVSDLEELDIVQVIDCDEFSRALETLPQSVFVPTIEETYVERFVEKLSQWRTILQILNTKNLDEETNKIVQEINSLLPLLEEKEQEKISKEKVEQALEDIKSDMNIKIKEMTLSGESLIEVLSKGIIPNELKVVIREAITKTNLPEELFLQTIPVTIDEQELEKIMRKQSLNQFTSIAERIKLRAKELSQIPKKLKELETRLLLYDFTSGISQWKKEKNHFPKIQETLALREAKNLFLNNPQPISFHLNPEFRCSILTGANSGGKTTLLEHILQAITCHQIGLPFEGEFSSPLFTEIYYFAKNKGSMSKGAFETLLTQMSEIKLGEKTLILADEIEAVTEPGVAGKMINATAEYFINKNCYLVIATHLGHEIQKSLPNNARIDGIEAQGLSEDNELIVNHNPVLGKLAHSTPELIIEKMFKTNDNEYFKFLYESIMKNGE